MLYVMYDTNDTNKLLKFVCIQYSPEGLECSFLCTGMQVF